MHSNLCPEMDICDRMSFIEYDFENRVIDLHKDDMYHVEIACVLHLK